MIKYFKVASAGVVISVLSNKIAFLAERLKFNFQIEATLKAPITIAADDILKYAFL